MPSKRRSKTPGQYIWLWHQAVREVGETELLRNPSDVEVRSIRRRFEDFRWALRTYPHETSRIVREKELRTKLVVREIPGVGRSLIAITTATPGLARAMAKIIEEFS